MYSKYYPGIFFLLVLIICIFTYSSGLNGGFLFDDYPNLKDMGAYGEIDDYNKIKNFISNGFSGPTGRPISLLSFLIDSNNWPANPYSFKYTNLMFHLLNGVLLFWSIILLLKNYKYEENKIIWIALISASIWILHPYFVSTTLYIVQRMAQLATLFSLIGIVGYLKARLLLPQKKIKAYVWMSLSISIGTILATYSKENGALLPLLVLIIEFCNPNKSIKPAWQWKAFFLWIPSISIAFLLIKYMNFDENPWPNRNYNMIERLYSESRILVEYLYNIFIPQVELRGLYQDGYNVSRSILNPISTLYSIVFIVFLLFTAFFYKNKSPLYALAILFYFGAHLIESTVIGLELYFEHRNYLAALFLFLPIAEIILKLERKVDYKLTTLVIVVVLMILSFFTYERSKLWGNTQNLELYWASISPDSPRAQNAIAGMLFDQGRYVDSNIFLQNAIQKIPQSSLLNMRLLLQKVYLGQATKQDFDETVMRLVDQPFDAQAIQALRILVEYIVDNNLCLKYGDSTIRFIQYLEENAKQYNQYPMFIRLMPYLKAKIYLGEEQVDLALKDYLIALNYYHDVEAGMMMVAELASHGNIKEALILLNKVELVYAKQEVSTLKRSSKEYDNEIFRIREILENSK